MAFVNEYISQEDIEKYNLQALCDKYREDDTYTAVPDPSEGKPQWTVDREREIWLLRIASVSNPNYDLPSATNEERFILHYQGVDIEVWAKSENVTEATDIPFVISWRYLGMSPKSVGDKSEKELKTIVCEALKVFKHIGIFSRKADITKVIFKNF